LGGLLCYNKTIFGCKKQFQRFCFPTVNVFDQSLNISPLQSKVNMSIVTVKKQKTDEEILQELSKYIIFFDSVFLKEDLNIAFSEHLKKEFNLEPLQFMMEVRELDEKDMSAVKKILETYIYDGSPKEINLSGKIKQKILNATKELKDSEDTNVVLEFEPKKIFEESLKNVYAVMGADSFPRFIRTEEAKKIYTKYLGNKEIMSPMLAVSYQYKDENFYECETLKHLVMNDIQFLKSMLVDSFDWNLVDSQPDSMNIYISTVNYLPNVSFFKDCVVIKWDYIMPYNYKDIFMNNSRDEQVDGMITNVDCLDLQECIYKDQEFIFGKFDMDIKLPFPFSMRKYLFTATSWYDQENETYYWINKPYIPETLQHVHDVNNKVTFSNVHTSKTAKPKKVGCIVYYSFEIFIYKKINDHLTSCQQVHLKTMNGWAGLPMLKNSILIKRGAEIRNFTHLAMKNPISEEDFKKSTGIGKVASKCLK
jgi:hypothetical protein